MGITHGLSWLLLLPLNLASFENKLEKPGIKMLRIKDLAVRVLRFSNPDYPQLIREANGIIRPFSRVIWDDNRAGLTPIYAF